MNVLVCGGAGYIGSHMVKMLSDSGHHVVTFDNLSTGHRNSVKWGTLVEGDLLNSDDLDVVFSKHPFDAVIHFAARSLVGESEQNPELYYRNNVVGTMNLLDAMHRHGVDRIIFSSTAAVYGNPETDTISENHPKNPINVYGKSKLMVESILNDYSNAYGISSVCLRYFNAAGADPEGMTGERHEPETHLIPNIIRSLLRSGDAELKVFGNDYDTADGTCVRDYIHVNDLCSAHLLAAGYLAGHEGAFTFNLGNGTGFSVMQILRAVEEVAKQAVEFEIQDRRKGDPAVLVADARLAQLELGWEPQYSDISDIIRTAWNWHTKRNVNE
ncbi:UDP-glucose 4-epimerase GalE [Mariprofundus ferrooxydans]|nr:UDP-glucose 4-epimerase GalE [Mariprofundus ferrooxydans]